jgi:hypothetical protein
LEATGDKVMLKQMNRSSLLVYCIAAIALLLTFGIAYQLRLDAGKMSVVAAANAHVPVTVEWVERAIDADGTERFLFEKTFARRDDGATVMAEHRFYRGSEGQPLEMRLRTVTDPSARIRTSIYPDVQGKVTVAIPQRALESLTNAVDPSCAVNGFRMVEDAGVSDILGHPVLRRERRLESSDGVHRGPHEVEWVAPALGCVALRSELVSHDKDGIVIGRVLREATGVNPGEPSAELFVVQEELGEMMPSEIMAAQNRLQGIECTTCDATAASNGDRFYLANRPSSAN